MIKQDYIVKLKNILSRIQEKVERLTKGKREIFVFGAGNTTALYAKCFEVEGINPVGYLDNSPAKQGTQFLGGGVISPDDIKGRKDVLVLICSVQIRVQQEVSKQLQGLGLDFLSVDEYVFAKRADEIIRCAESLYDDESVKVYSEIIESRLMSRMPSPEIFSHNIYLALPEFYQLEAKEIFVDCGAFVGDTVEQYIFTHCGMFGKIFAFEPDNINFNAMQVRIDRLNREWGLSEDKIKLVNAGVGIKTSTGIVENHNGLGSRISINNDSSEKTIKIYALDDFFQDQRVDFLKADIESFELDMLKGAENIIRRDLPKLAICIYHNASDLYQILLWLKDLNLDYKFAIRHHVPPYYDTILYAYQ